MNNLRANIQDLSDIGSKTIITGVKLQLFCETHKRKWSIWFRDENELLNNLPTDFYICGDCKKENIVNGDKESGKYGESAKHSAQ